ncbi:hypothetical protein RB594_007282 [Gaeumannomyces avenae]
MDAEIDALLERYLGLLDEYAELRASLGAVQSGMYQNIARANFAAERGMRKEPGSSEPMAEANQQSYDGVAGTNGATAKASPATRKDPLRWFGLFTPTSLRLAQGQAVEIVEDLLPRIASVDAEMGQVEIQVRRAKKKRSKAATAAEKETRTAQQAERSSGETSHPVIL